MLILVIEVCIAVGERVEKGQAVVVLESMETEKVLRTPVWYHQEVIGSFVISPSFLWIEKQ